MYQTGNPEGNWTTEVELQRLAGIYAGLPTTLEQDQALLADTGAPDFHRDKLLDPSRWQHLSQSSSASHTCLQLSLGMVTHIGHKTLRKR